MEAKREIGLHRPLRLELRLKNNVLWHAIYDHYGSISAFCRQHPRFKRVTPRVNRLINLRDSPFSRRNPAEYKLFCLELASTLRVPPDALFPRAIYERVIVSKRVMEVSLAALPSSIRREVRGLPAPIESCPDAQLVRRERYEAIIAALDKTASPRNREIVKLHYGLGEYEGTTKNDEEIGKLFGLSGARVGQILEAARRKLRLHPRWSSVLADFLRSP